MDEKGAADKTLKIKQVDGAVTAEEVAIQIKQSQVTDLERQLSQRLQAQEFYDFKEDEFVPLQTAINNLDSTINTKIQALDGTASQTAGADGLALSVTTTDGVVTAISGSIAANTYDAYGAAAGVKEALENGAIKTNADAIKTMQGSDTTLSMREVAAAEAKSAVEALDVDDTAVAGQFVTAVAQENGAVKISRAAVNIKNLAQDTNSYVVFDCGTSEINI